MDPIKYARQRIAEIAESRKPVPYHEPDPGYSPTAAFYQELAAEAIEDDAPDFENVRAEVLLTAESLVNGDRNASYGDPNQDFNRTASFWNEYLCGVAERKLGNAEEEVRDIVLDTLCCLIDSHDIGHMMTLLKISRSTVSPGKLDHYIDSAGYQACAAHCATVNGAPS